MEMLNTERSGRLHHKMLNLLVQNSLLVACVVFAIGASFGATDQVDKSLGTVRGTVSRITGDHIEPVGKVWLTFSGATGSEFETATDSKGEYEIKLPSGPYHVVVNWFGDCSQIHRAPFKLEASKDLTFDFLAVSCRVVDMEGNENGIPVPPSESEAAMNLPLGHQSPEYREQVISASGNRPEIVVSFGKYDNQGDHIEYFPLDNQIIKNLSTRPFIAMPLPVTVTVDRYTIRALAVVWDKKAMTFHATGDASISDGHTTHRVHSAILSFPDGVPNVHSDK